MLIGWVTKPAGSGGGWLRTGVVVACAVIWGAGPGFGQTASTEGGAGAQPAVNQERAQPQADENAAAKEVPAENGTSEKLVPGTVSSDPGTEGRKGLFSFLPDWMQIRGQATYIIQDVPGFPAAYDGKFPSLPSRHQAEMSHSYTLFLGLKPLPWLEGYVDPEIIRGDGVNHGSGLAGEIDGDVIRNPQAGKNFYGARYFGRVTVPLGGETEKMESDDHQFVGDLSVNRVSVWFGKFGSNDIFDTNAYANSTRTQFMNWSFINNTAWDYAADTRGYTVGVAMEINTKFWALRLGSFEMPTTANGIDLSGDWTHNRGDNAEFEIRPRFFKSVEGPTKIKFLAFRNISNAGRYSDAIKLAEATGTTPDITAVGEPATAKYGFGLNVEQPLADDGDTGLFARLGWNNDTTETYAFTEVGHEFSLGAQISGKNWGRADDRFGIAYGQNFLSNEHREYLELGGAGFQVGDGRLDYGPEMIGETYYSARVLSFVDLSLGYQLIFNPGYNRDRGPVSVISFRVHLFF